MKKNIEIGPCTFARVIGGNCACPIFETVYGLLGGVVVRALDL